MSRVVGGPWWPAKMVAPIDVVPRGYGFAYYRQMWSVCYPIPLNIVIAAARNVWLALMWKWVPRKYEERVGHAYFTGYDAGMAKQRAESAVEIEKWRRIAATEVRNAVVEVMLEDLKANREAKA